MRRLCRLSCALALSAALFVARASEGQTTGSIDGRITDSNGAPLSGVTVRASGPALQGLRAATTGRDGVYRMPALPPGTYRIESSLEGFRTASLIATCSLGSTATGDFVLTLAAVEGVLVSGEAPLIDMASAASGTHYTSALIARLPVDRNYADIVRANPGVTPDNGQTAGRGLALSIDGATSVENQWIVDGIDTTNVIKGFQGKALNNEFIEEVEVKSGGYQAEYGRALGGIVNVITKSGGNRYRGDAFVYDDSESTRARQIVTDLDSLNGMRITPARRTEFGADLGGFLLKDRVWFFAAYDRIDTPGTASRYVPSAAVPGTLLFPRDQLDDLYSGKLTWNIASRTTLVATALSDPSRITGAARAGTTGGLISNPAPGTWESRREIGGTDFGLRLSQFVSSNAIVVLMGSRHRDRFELFPSAAGSAVRFEDWTCEQDATGFCTPPPAPNAVEGGMGNIGGPQQRNASVRDQYRADGTAFFANHEIRAGGDYRDGKSTLVTAYTGGQQVSRWNDTGGAAYYRHDFWARSATDTTPSDAVVRVRAVEKSVYLQDSWKAAAGMTVNLGLRWDQEELRDFQDAPLIKTTAAWQPRVGIVWDPGRGGRMKLSASVGRFYYSLPTDLAVFAGGTVLLRTYNFDRSDTTQRPDVPGHGTADLPAGGSPQVDAGIRGAYQDELRLGVERMVFPGFSVGLSGIYRRLGRAIENRCDLDSSREENHFSSCATINPGSGGQFARGDFYAWNGLEGDASRLGQGAPASVEARRLYRAIELVARKTVGERFWLQASYVYSSLRGNYDGGVSESSGETNPGASADFDFPQEWSHDSYGKLFLDRPHRLRADVAYSTPIGLSVGLQAYVQSGAPLDQAGYLNDAGFAYGSSVQLVPRGGAGRLPTLWEVNLTLGYPIATGPLTLTAQASVFNLFNNQIETRRDVAYTTSATPDYPNDLYDPPGRPTNENYGRILSRQDPRLFRASLKLSF